MSSMGEWCKQHRRDPLSEQQKTLNAKLHGHSQYSYDLGSHKARRVQGVTPEKATAEICTVGWVRGES